MKYLILLMTISTISAASAHSVKECHLKAREFYQQSVEDSGVEYSIDIRDAFANADDKLIYKVTGTEHSGWFMDHLVLSSDCELIGIYNVYSE